MITKNNTKKNRDRAYSLVRTAIKRGTLIRPESCSRCGGTGRTSDGRSFIHAHHHDYLLPLDVEWICAKCHRLETPLPKVMGAPVYGDANGMRIHKGILAGSKNGFSKLDESKVEIIKSLRYKMKAKDIASMFYVKTPTINDIFNGRTWIHVSVASQPETDRGSNE